ncbi:MFS transporter [Chitinophaga silvisoli]|uniref:MFS transporter n=1 Tax=Chitinophaga silvisoli TaxID=2291814 RepID=A0A3E1NZZ6_9BACT|nr:MFS transporter [Chitinophaga silvisoli]RFM33434.1 MFS transporter [Chitinophaga silvisoli]
MQSLNKNLVLAIASMGIFVEALDIAIVNLALPKIEADLGLTNDSGYKIQSIYILIYGSFLILGGKLSDYLGRKTIFIAGCAIFLFTSLGAGLTHTLNHLILFRALQGLGAALLMPSAFSIVNYYFTEPHERGKAMGIFGSFAATGSAGGVSVGGIIANYLGWSWVFLINVPILLVILVIAYIYLEKDVRTTNAKLPDFPAAIALVLGMLCLSKITEGSYVMIAILGLLIASWFLYYRLKTQANPLLDLKVLLLASLRKGTLLFFLLGALFTGYLFLMSFLVQQNFHFTAAQSGFLMMPFNIISMLLGRFGLPALSKKFTPKTIAIGGAAGMLIGSIALVLAVQVHSLFFLLFGGACIAGIGMTLCYTGYTVIAMEHVPSEHLGIAASLINTAYFVGGGIGLPLISLFMSHTSATLDSRPIWILCIVALFSISRLLYSKKLV